MRHITKDRLTLIADINAQRNKVTAAGGILALAHSQSLLNPSSSNLRCNGIYGQSLENLLGGALSGSLPDYKDCELKTRTDGSGSYVTLANVASDDYYKEFVDSSLYAKIKRTVFVTLERSPTPFVFSGVNYEDRLIGDVSSMDLTQPSLFKTFKQDFDLHVSRQPLQVLPKRPRILVLEEASGRTRWRLSLAALRIILNSDKMQGSGLFEFEE